MRLMIVACVRAGLAYALASAIGSAAAQADYPSRPVRVIVPFGAGSGVDAVARNYAERLGALLKSSFIVENRDGVGGTLGTVAVAKAAPDGYTLLFTANPPFAIAPAVQGGAPYDPTGDFAPIYKVAATPMVLIASNDAPFKTFAEFVAYAKANPGKLSYASTGIGTPSHLSVELIKQRLGLSLEAIHYKSSSQALTDTLGGHVPLYMPSFPAANAQLLSGKVRSLAIGSPTRMAAAPETPTLAEVLKEPGLESRVWYGFLAPKGTPAAIIDKLAVEIARASAAPETTAQIVKLGAEPLLVGPTAFAAQIRVEAAAELQLIQKLNIGKP